MKVSPSLKREGGDRAVAQLARKKKIQNCDYSKIESLGPSHDLQHKFQRKRERELAASCCLIFIKKEKGREINKEIEDEVSIRFPQ